MNNPTDDDLEVIADGSEFLNVVIVIALAIALIASTGMLAFGDEVSARMAVIDAQLTAQAMSRPALPDDFKRDDHADKTNDQASIDGCQCGCGKTGCSCSASQTPRSRGHSGPIRGETVCTPATSQSAGELSHNGPRIIFVTSATDWCGPCRDELPRFNAARQSATKARFDVIRSDVPVHVPFAGGSYFVRTFPAYLFQTTDGTVRIARTWQQVLDSGPLK